MRKSTPDSIDGLARERFILKGVGYDVFHREMSDLERRGLVLDRMSDPNYEEINVHLRPRFPGSEKNMFKFKAMNNKYW